VGDAEPTDQTVWTEIDFDKMGWHDVAVHALGFEQGRDSARLLLDIDYILQWLDPVPPSDFYSFVIAPATLVFENVWSLKGDLDAEAIGERTLLQIESIERTDADDRAAARGLQRWTVLGHNFELTFLAGGYRQHLRRRACTVNNAQRLSSQERGGIGFAQPQPAE
jgi:hypothetical protein